MGTDAVLSWQGSGKDGNVGTCRIWSGMSGCIVPNVAGRPTGCPVHLACRVRGEAGLRVSMRCDGMGACGQRRLQRGFAAAGGYSKGDSGRTDAGGADLCRPILSDAGRRKRLSLPSVVSKSERQKTEIPPDRLHFAVQDEDRFVCAGMRAVVCPSDNAAGTGASCSANPSFTVGVGSLRSSWPCRAGMRRVDGGAETVPHAVHAVAVRTEQATLLRRCRAFGVYSSAGRSSDSSSMDWGRDLDILMFSALRRWARLTRLPVPVRSCFMALS